MKGGGFFPYIEQVRNAVAHGGIHWSSYQDHRGQLWSEASEEDGKAHRRRNQAWSMEMLRVPHLGVTWTPSAQVFHTASMAGAGQFSNAWAYVDEVWARGPRW